MRYEQVPWEAAACKGILTDLFFLEQNEARILNPMLKGICHGCPIYAECMEYAVENEQQGFWAGLTAKERRRLRGRMSNAA